MHILSNAHYYTDIFGFDSKLLKLSEKVEENISGVVRKIDTIREINQLKVIVAMQECGLSETHFIGSSGYGYGDVGREVLDRIYSKVFKSEASLVRHNIVAGTHAISLAMFGNLRPGDELLSITGQPYDTLEEVIGLRGSGSGSLIDFGISYRQVDIADDGAFDLESIRQSINSKTRMVFIQRSRGYSWRNSILCREIASIIRYIKNLKNDIIVLVDNCYGEFVEETEPIEAGADLIAGSLIKNPGGGLAPSGGYIAGKEQFVLNAAYRLTTPGLGNKVGPTLGLNRSLFQGLFMAPHVVGESLRGAVFTAGLMQALGFDVSPGYIEERTDIIQAIRFKSSELLIAFCQGIQKGSPVDSFVVPYPWDMPGYECKVIMAAGGFIQGSSIELSADAPVKPPYTAYLQGGLVFEGVKLGVLTAINSMLVKGMINSL